MSELLRQVIVIVWPGLGVGPQGESGAPLQRVAAYVGGLEAPTLAWLGLGNVAPIRGLGPASPPAASHGRLQPPIGLDALLGEAARALVALGRAVQLVGDAGEALAVEGAAVHAARHGQSVLERAADLAQGSAPGLIVASPGSEECPASASPVTAARAVQRLDTALARLLDRLAGREDVMVVLTTADELSRSTSAEGHARVADPGPAKRSRWAPVLVHLGALPSGVALGDRAPGDLGATVAEALGATVHGGRSFLPELLA